MKLSELVGVRALGLRVVVGGGTAGELPVTGAFITDLPDPSRFLGPGTVVLSNGLWVERPDGVERFVQALVGVRATALVLGLVELGEVPPELVEVARREGLVVATLPEGASFGSVVQAVVEGVGGPPAATSPAAELAARIQQTVADGALDGGLALVRDRFGVDCWVVDDDGTVPVVAGDLDAALVVAVWAGKAPSVGVTSWPLGPPRSRARLVAHHPGADLVPEAARAFDTLAAVLRPELRFAHRSRTARWERTSGLLTAATDESLPRGEVAALSRLAALDPQEPLRVLLARTSGAEFPVEALVELLGRVGAGDGVRIAVGLHAGTATAVLSEPPAAPGLGVRLTQALPEPLDLLDGRTLVVATSDPVTGVGGLASALAVATERLGEFDARPGPAAGTVVLLDSSAGGDHRSLLRMLPASARAAFAAGVLGELEDYDRRHGADLVSTVRVFLDHGGAWQDAARALHVHPNTLRYRIARIEEVTGRDLSTIRDRVDVFLALQCRPAPGDG